MDSDSIGLDGYLKKKDREKIDQQVHGQIIGRLCQVTLIFCSPCFLRPTGAACFIWAQGAGNGFAVLAIQSVARVAARLGRKKEGPGIPKSTG